MQDILLTFAGSVVRGVVLQKSLFYDECSEYSLKAFFFEKILWEAEAVRRVIDI